MIQRAKWMACAFVAAMAAGCLQDAGRDTGLPYGALVSATECDIAGDSLFIPAYTDTAFYCDSSGLESEPRTMPKKAARFALAPGRLTVFNAPDTLAASGALAQGFTSYARVGAAGAGGGPGGLWLRDSIGYAILSGPATAQEKSDLDAGYRTLRRSLAYWTYHLLLGEGRARGYLDGRTAQRFIDDWNGVGPVPSQADSGAYAITAKVSDPHTVELKGRKSGETVRLTMDPSGDRTYASSDPAHPTHTYTVVPESCPDDWEPEWYRTFLADNAKKYR